MTNLRLIVPVALVAQVLALLRELASVTNVVHLPGAGIEPEGDLISADVAREDVSLVVDRLRALGLDETGAIALEAVDASVSRGARQAMHDAEGFASDAVLWEQVEQTVSESSDLSFTFLAFMAIATCLAAIGILIDSAILIVGAMVVGPEFGPLAALSVALVRRRRGIARRSAVALVAGFGVGILAAFLLTSRSGRSISARRPRRSRSAPRRSSSPTRTRSRCSSPCSPARRECSRSSPPARGR